MSLLDANKVSAWPQEEEESLLQDTPSSLCVWYLALGTLGEQGADQNRLSSAPSVSGFCLASWLCLLLGALCSSLPLSAAVQQETGRLLFLQWSGLGRSLSWESSGQKRPGVAKTKRTNQAGIRIFRLSLVFILSPPSMAAPG